MTNIQSQNRVILTASAWINDNRLTIEYQVLNNQTDAIYLVNRVFQWTSQGLQVGANLVFTEIVGGQLRLVKACLAVPERVKVESPDVPYLTYVSAGETFSETIALELPLQPFHPYDQIKIGNEVRVFDSVQLAVGWFSEGKVAVRSSQLPDGVSLLSADYGPVMREQEVLIITLPVSIVTYIKEF